MLADRIMLPRVNNAGTKMANHQSDLEFPKGPGYYSVFQTSPVARILVLGLLLIGILLGTVGFLLTYVDRPQEIGLGVVIAYVVTVLILAALAFVLWIARPFLVRHSTIHLVRSVMLKDGTRTRAIPFSQVSDASIAQTQDDEMEVWISLKDGPRFRMIIFDDDEGREFARRFVEYFSRTD